MVTVPPSVPPLGALFIVAVTAPVKFVTGTPPSPGAVGKPLPGKAMNETQAKAVGFGSRAYAANTVVNRLEDAGVTGAAFGPQLLEKAGKYGREFGGTAGTIIGIVAGGTLGGGVGAVPGAAIGEA
jgi:hypothetical protein